ncbi:hypothetical protein BM526_15435 [Alteromonas mediterranea]|uniref:type IV toxin-antitoxin system AbiEi family antitoxin n=1 Tax=Alteromonas mediterranea TaxID=314275 RepID=UPI0009038BE2|nr:type IV toxin-antitoxin system AbiEi family antitoxin [Alteromonas mediterranea]APE03119.1 hypothetical protein BM526_15435 [Alteromonas mediterranea]
MNILLAEAARLLAANTKLNVTYTHPNIEAAPMTDGQLTIIHGDQKYTWFVEAKERLTRHRLHKLQPEKTVLSDKKALIVTTYINENIAELCRELQFDFLDLADNAYLNTPPFYIDIRGKKPPQEHQIQRARKLTGKAFQPKGMKLVMMLLLKPELVNQPMRVLAQQAEIALGTVKQVLDDLKQLTFIIGKGKKGFVLNEKDLLLTRWLDAYPHNMEAKLEQKLYVPQNIEQLRNAPVDKYGALWGEEVAADAYTHYLTPKTYQIYADAEAHRALLKTFRLRRLRAEERDVNILKIVEPPVGIEKIRGELPSYVAPLLVYAELLNSDDPRNLETAKRIYIDYLA